MQGILATGAQKLGKLLCVSINVVFEDSEKHSKPIIIIKQLKILKLIEETPLYYQFTLNV